MSADDLRQQLERQEALGERAYTLMYDAVSPTAAAGHYSDAKEAFNDAIRLAREAGRPQDVERLEKRLAHIKAVFRSQFS